ncbi:MAG: M28 family metallopeptidase, partial [bacterium]
IDTWPGTVGASDNAYGCAMLVEFGRWFKEHPPDRTVRLVWFTGEELDCRGSRAYVERHGGETQNIILYVNVDSGISIEHGKSWVAVSGGNQLLKAVEILVDRLKEGVKVHKLTNPDYDTTAFAERGIPTVSVCARLEGPLPHPHLPTDRFDKLDERKIKFNGGLSLAIIAAGAMGKLSLVRPDDLGRDYEGD